MRRSILIALAALPGLALAGCQSAAERRAAQTGEIDVTNASTDEVAGLIKAAQSHAPMQPGKWRFRSDVLAADLSGLPEAQRAPTQAALEKQKIDRTSCRTAKELKPVDLDALTRVAGACTFERYTARGGRIDAQLACTQGATTTRIGLQGTSGATGFDVAIDQQTGRPGTPGAMSIRMRARGERIGDCG